MFLVYHKGMDRQCFMGNNDANATISVMGNMAKKKTEIDRLLDAAARYIDKAGGKAVVIGGIGLMERGEFRHSLVINFTGRAPVKPSNKSGGSE